ncbi:MAG TPA: hypothetical protein RMF84_07900 [Polyangiaceae bacterium LLY-WYZ-14_1]|nr:hypothetical protein [Polyangiaceae bacterium LLY-WYZ-14_1]
MTRAMPLLLTLFVCAEVLSAQNHTASPPHEGGPRNWQVTGVEGVLDLRGAPSTSAEIVGRLAPAVVPGGIACKGPDGRQRTAYFRTGVPIGADVSQADRTGPLSATKEAELHFVRVGDERYEIPDAVVLGG